MISNSILQTSSDTYIGNKTETLNNCSKNSATEIDTVLSEFSRILIENSEITEKQKIWISLLILDALQREASKCSQCEERFTDLHDVNVTGITAQDHKLLQKYNRIRKYNDCILQMIQPLALYFEKYMQENEDQFFSRKISEESREEYSLNILNHYVDGIPWTDEADKRSNIINKVESFFRGFSKKNL